MVENLQVACELNGDLHVLKIKMKLFSWNGQSSFILLFGNLLSLALLYAASTLVNNLCPSWE